EQLADLLKATCCIIKRPSRISRGNPNANLPCFFLVPCLYGFYRDELPFCDLLAACGRQLNCHGVSLICWASHRGLQL
ncbi:unnamed protein product, partial [Prunus brigantina]